MSAKVFKYEYVPEFNSDYRDHDLFYLIEKIDPENEKAMEFKDIMLRILKYVSTAKIDLKVRLSGVSNHAHFVFSARRFRFGPKSMDFFRELAQKTGHLSIDRISQPWGDDITFVINFSIDQSVIDTANAIDEEFLGLLKD